METRVILDKADRPKDSLVVVHSMQDVEPILEYNKELRTQPQHSDWGRHVASIPNVIITQWLNEEWMRGNVGLRPFTKEFDELVKRKLNDPDWKYLRTDSQSVQGIMGFGS